jgi:hypothetical protein
VVEGANKKPLAGAEVSVHYGIGKVHVTRKITDAQGQITFSGWCGKATPIAHTVVIVPAADGGCDGLARAVSHELQLKPQDHVGLTIPVSTRNSHACV